MGIKVSLNRNFLKKEGLSLRSHETLRQRGFSHLKILRRSKGITLEQLSNLTGVSPSYLSRLECGTRRLNTDLIGKLATVLECEPSDLLNNVVAETAAAKHWTSSKDEDDFRLPIYRIHAVKNSAEGPQRDPLSAPVEWHVSPPKLRSVEESFGVLLSDNTYAPFYHAGDVLYVNPSQPIVTGMVYFVLRYKQGPLIAILQSDTEDFVFKTFSGEEWRFDKSEIKSVWRVVGCWYY